ncbi:MAG: HTH cro/C1-type protein [Dehalococcoidia bacterium]|nr:HTH cro/C1-type protein [Dehalococcoidia bacterium]
MVPIKPELYDYLFDRAVIANIRKELGLSQAKLADLLDIPVNTLSRWEIGATTPDADTLAAIYAIAKQHNLSPNFFKRRISMKQATKHRTKLVLAWDFQNLALSVDKIEEEWGYMKKYLDLIFPATRASRLLRVYSSQPEWAIFSTFFQQGVSKPTVKGTFEALKFEVFEGYYDADSQLVRDSMRECITNPRKTIFILVSKDGDYAETLKEMKRIGVDVYIWSEKDEISERLASSIENGNLILWNKPYLVAECVEVIKALKGGPVKRGSFGQQCHEKLQENEIYPQDVGFSRRNPYGSLLTWLESHGIVEIRIVKEPDLISFKMRSSIP